MYTGSPTYHLGVDRASGCYRSGGMLLPRAGIQLNKPQSQYFRIPKLEFGNIVFGACAVEPLCGAPVPRDGAMGSLSSKCIGLKFSKVLSPKRCQPLPEEQIPGSTGRTTGGDSAPRWWQKTKSLPTRSSPCFPWEGLGNWMGGN
jgi:hypothetical protein